MKSLLDLLYFNMTEGSIWRRKPSDGFIFYAIVVQVEHNHVYVDLYSQNTSKRTYSPIYCYKKEQFIDKFDYYGNRNEKSSESN